MERPREEVGCVMSILVDDDVIERLDRARATTYVTSKALDAGGETDLEILSAIALRGVSDTLEEIHDQLFAIKRAAEEATPS